MKNLLLYLGLSFGLVTFQVQAMDNQKQLVNTSPQKSPQKLQVQGVWDSPDKRFLEGSIEQIFSPFQPDNPSKQEVESPIKIGGLTQHELALSLDSPEKIKQAIEVSKKIVKSPGGMYNVYFSPEKRSLPFDQILAHPGTSKVIGTWFEIPHKMRIDAIAKNPQAVDCLIIDSNVLAKDNSRVPQYRVLPKLSEIVASLYIFNAKKELRDFNNNVVTLHSKTTSCINEKGEPRVSGMASDNVTFQSINNKEMSLYSKNPEDRQAHELFVKRILPFCTKYRQLAQGTHESGDFSPIIDFHKLPPALPTLPLETTQFSFYTDEYNAEPFITKFLRNDASHVSIYSISGTYLTNLAKNKQVDVVVNHECYDENKAVESVWKRIVKNGIGRAGVYRGKGAELHTKFLLNKQKNTTIISENNLTQTGMRGSYGKITCFFNNEAMYEKCARAFEDQLKDPDTHLIPRDETGETLDKQANAPFTQKRPIDNNNNNNNDNNNNNNDTRNGRAAKRIAGDHVRQSLVDKFNATKQ